MELFPLIQKRNATNCNELASSSGKGTSKCAISDTFPFLMILMEFHHTVSNVESDLKFDRCFH